MSTPEHVPDCARLQEKRGGLWRGRDCDMEKRDPFQGGWDGFVDWKTHETLKYACGSFQGWDGGVV